MKVCEIICGDNHTLAVLENADDGHELFVWGSSKSWQLGLDGDLSDDVLDPHSIDPDPFDGKVLTIGGCHNYSSCVTQDGKVKNKDFITIRFIPGEVESLEGLGMQQKQDSKKFQS